MYFTDFLHPVEWAGNSRSKDAVPYGGYDGAERCMLGYFDYEPDFSCFPIGAVEISYNTKFTPNLSHRDFLGSILGLGINRAKIGDILLYYGKAIAFAHVKIIPFIRDNLITVANTSVETKQIELSEIDIPIKLDVNICINVSSLRLDTVVAAAFNISRSESAELINKGKVFINWSETTNTSRQVSPDNVITVRGMGRIKVIGVNGKTKKDRFILEIQKSN